MPTTPTNGSPTEVVLATAADEAYAVPLAVTIRSVLDQLAPNRRLRLYVLNGGISDSTKARLLWSWLDPRLTVVWLEPNIELVRDLPVSDHISIIAYVRLLMPSLLPESLSRIIYLDADMMVRCDLSVLWDESPRSQPLLAVQEYAAPYFDTSSVVPNYDKCHRFLAANNPVANFRELGLSGRQKYFNSGLLVINLAEWRRQRYAEQVLACLRTHRQHVLWWDQYALNVVFAGKWGELDHRWNQGAHIHVYPSWRESPFDRATFERLRDDPWIVHFCSPTKPWHYFCHHPRTAEWRRCLRETDWCDWKPEKPEDYLNKLWDFYYQPLRSEWKRNVRALKQRIRGERKKAA